MAKIQITTPGIRKALAKYDYSHAISEYIWNGFDAGANSIEIFFKPNAIGNIDTLKITDNGLYRQKKPVCPRPDLALGVIFLDG